MPLERAIQVGGRVFPAAEAGNGLRISLHLPALSAASRAKMRSTLNGLEPHRSSQQLTDQASIARSTASELSILHGRPADVSGCGALDTFLQDPRRTGPGHSKSGAVRSRPEVPRPVSAGAF